jgi:hypothetical protein
MPEAKTYGGVEGMEADIIVSVEGFTDEWGWIGRCAKSTVSQRTQWNRSTLELGIDAPCAYTLRFPLEVEWKCLVLV